MAFLGTRNRVRDVANPSNQLTNPTGTEQPSVSQPNRQRRTSPSVSSELSDPPPERQSRKRRRASSSVNSERSPSPDALVELRAQEKALRKAKRNEEFACLQKSVAELLKESKSAVDD